MEGGWAKGDSSICRTVDIRHHCKTPVVCRGAHGAFYMQKEGMGIGKETVIVVEAHCWEWDSSDNS